MRTQPAMLAARATVVRPVGVDLLALNTTLSWPSSSEVAVRTDSMASESALQTSGVSTPRASCTRCSSAVAASKADGGGGGAVAEPVGASEVELLPNGQGGKLKGQGPDAEQVIAPRRLVVTAVRACSSVKDNRTPTVGARPARNRVSLARFMDSPTKDRR